MTISLRLLMSGVIALVTLISALVAFVPTYDASVRGVRSSLLDLRRAYVARAQNQTQGFFDAPTMILDTLRLAASRGIVTFDIGVPAERARWIAWLYDTATRYPDLLNKATIIVPLSPNMRYNETDLIVCTTELAREFPSIGAVAGIMNFTNRTVYFRSLDSNGRVTNIDPSFGGVIPVTEALFPGTALPLMQTPGATTGWAPAATGFTGPELDFSELMRDTSGAVIAGVTLTLLHQNFRSFLMSLGLRSRGRAFAVDARTGIVMGLSTAESASELLAYLDQSKPTWERVHLKTPSNVSDPLIREVVRAVGENEILSKPAPFDRVIETQYGRTYLDVLEVTGPGLRLRTVLIMPELDFLEDVFKIQRATFGGAAGAILAMIALAFLLGHVLTAPFLRLRDRMYLTASLQDDSEADSPSFLTEVRGMQRSYSMMRGELAKVKSYLPQSVLTALQRGASDSATDFVDEMEDDVEEGETDPPSISEYSGQPRTGLSSQRSSPGASPRNSPSGSRSNMRNMVAIRDGPLATALLNTSSSLAHRRVTVVCFNLRGFNNYCLASTAGEIASAEARLVDCVSQHVVENRGVIDLFHGDRLQASFNAVTPCAGHSKRAALAALSVVRSIDRDHESFHATAGLSVGHCYTGNVGSSTLKRFCILGTAVPQAAALERMSRLFGASVLCPSMMFQELAPELLLRSVGIVRLPGMPKPRVIGSIEGLKSVKMEEWMYQLKEGEDSDPFVLPNSFFAAAAEGNAELASRIMTTLRAHREEPAISTVIPVAEQLLSLITSSALLGSAVVMSDTSAYYQRCVAHHETDG